MSRADEPQRAPRRAPKVDGERLYAEHYGPGERLVWDHPPLIRDGAAMVPAPSVLGTVSWSTGGVAFVRFYLGGKLGEPREVVPQQPCSKEPDL